MQKKITNTLLFIVLFPLFGFSQSELLKQVGFESEIAGTSIVTNNDPYGTTLLNNWKLVVKSSSTGTGVISTEDKKNGLNSIKVQLNTIDYRYRFFLAQEVKNLAPAIYTFSLWVKADVGNIPFRVDAVNSAGTDLFKVEKRTVAGTWQNYSISIDLSAYAADLLQLVRFVIRPNCFAGGSITNTPVTYFFDDISCTGVVPSVILFQPKPYLQSKTQTGILINWFSASGETGTPTVEYGTTDFSGTAIGSMKNVSTTVWSSVTLSGLLPDTEYQYRCRVGSNVSDTYKFRTMPANNTSRKIRFLSFGDSHEVSTTQTVRTSALAKIKELYGNDIQNQVDFVVCTGDVNTSFGQVIDEWASVHFTPNKDLSNALPYNLTAGNHDFEKNDAQHSYFYDYMNFDALSDAPSNALGKYYAQQVGNALFVYLNSNNQYLCENTETNATYLANSNAQMSWLTNKLVEAESNNEIKMIFVFCHHGLHSEMWSDPNSNLPITKIYTTLYPVLNNSTKIKCLQYGHSHAFERGIYDLPNGSSFTLFQNGNSGSYPDYYGRYSLYINYPDILRSLEDTGFSITEIDPVAQTYTTKYYSVIQRRVVGTATSTSNVRTYNPALVVNEWSVNYSASRPVQPTIQAVSYVNEKISVECSTPTNWVTANYRIETANGSLLKDTILHFEDILGTTGYITNPDGSLNLTKAYLPLDLNTGIELNKFSMPIEVGSYQVSVRYQDNNLNWSDYSIKTNTLLANIESETSTINCFINGNNLVINSSVDTDMELITSTGVIVLKSKIKSGLNNVDIRAMKGIYFIRTRNNTNSNLYKILI